MSLELAYPLPQRSRDLGNSLRPEHENRHRENHQQVWKAQILEHLSKVKVACASSGAAPESDKQHELNHSSNLTVFCKEWNPVFDWLVRSLELGICVPSLESTHVYAIR